MDAFLTSTAVVALAEIGDKTMLLAILLATRFRKPLPIILGILFATLANHGLAALRARGAAHEVAHLVAKGLLRGGVGKLHGAAFSGARPAARRAPARRRAGRSAG